MTRLLLTLFFIGSFIFSGFSQTKKDFSSVDECYRKTFSIAVWVLTDTAGTPGLITQTMVQEAVDSLNHKFENICVDFKICTYTILPNHRQDTIMQGVHDSEIAALYHTPNVINLYFSTEIIIPTDPRACGYAPFGTLTVPNARPMRDAIFLKKPCFTHQVLEHEIGHYFGLYHTFETSFGNELSDGSNCVTAGDMICDTEADPDGASDAGCHLRDPQNYTDANGHLYTPPICNIMSYYNTSCSQTFTIGQLNKMLSVMKTGRNYLW